MINKETLEVHYTEYAERPDEWVEDREGAKKSIVNHVLKETQFESTDNPTRVVVLGASDKRYVSVHRKIFEEAIQGKVEMITFDIDTKHLEGEEGIVEHDVTNPFPNPPYTVVFSHELMKFLTPEQQLQVIKNSHDALSETGLAMHILHSPSIEGTKKMKEWQNRVNPDELIKELEKDNILVEKIVFDSDTNTDWLKKTTALAIRKNE